MAKFLPKLMQTHVRITGYGGASFDCPMLPVSARPIMDECAEALEKAASPGELDAVRHRLIALVRTVMPPPYADGLDRLPLESMTELVAYLMYGDGDDEPAGNGDAAPDPAGPAEI